LLFLEVYFCRDIRHIVMLHVELIDVPLVALNGDFKQRKKDSFPFGLVSHVGDILVRRVRWLLILLSFLLDLTTN